MARTYGRILSATWADPDWRELDTEAQHLYILLVTQPDISPCGVLPYLPRRWAGMAAGLTPGDVEARLERLVAARYVIVDDDTGELLIRSFVRHDGGLGNVKMRGAISNALAEIHSAAIRTAVQREIPAEHRGYFGLAPVDIVPDMPDTAVDNQPGMTDRTANDDRSNGHPIEHGEGTGEGFIGSSVPPLTPPPSGGEPEATNPRARGTNPRGPKRERPPRADAPRPTIRSVSTCRECGGLAGIDCAHDEAATG